MLIPCLIFYQMVSEKLQEVLILEDDVDFEPNFCDDLEQVLEEAHRLAPQLGCPTENMKVSKTNPLQVFQVGLP